jgi:DNA mismatch repair ATPase MutS
MKAHLMHRDQDFDLRQPLPPNEQALTQDLELDTLLDAMASGDDFLREVARKAVLSSLHDPEAIVYRQQVLQDCLDQPAIVREIYGIAVAAIASEKKIYRGIFGRYPESILHGSIEALQLFVGMLRQLRQVADEHAGKFRSDGFTELFGMLKRELDDDYFATVEEHLRQLRFRGGVLLSAKLGKGNRGTGYVLRRPRNSKQSWISRISGNSRSAYTLTIADRDESGARALGELRGRGINLVANAAAQSSDHLVSFFDMLRSELGFYIACLNLHGRLAQKGEPICFPLPLASGERALAFRGLGDVCLTLHLDERIVGNDVTADNKSLVMITGANQGGKSTFLRSIGLAYLMMQCGMFVSAEWFRSSVCTGLLTHYKREEDATMRSGKLDEELSRMNDLVTYLTPDSILLCNESFASTNEREGSEIARQIIHALLEAGIKVFYVTHLFDLAQGLYAQQLDTALFLRAERQSDARRTFRLAGGEPLPTSYGEDVYRRVFGSAPDAAPAAPVGPSR